MKFKNYLTGKTIEVGPVKSVESENVVWCQSLKKYFKVISQARGRDYLLNTHYFFIEEKQETLE